MPSYSLLTYIVTITKSIKGVLLSKKKEKKQGFFLYLWICTIMCISNSTNQSLIIVMFLMWNELSFLVVTCKDRSIYFGVDVLNVNEWKGAEWKVNAEWSVDARWMHECIVWKVSAYWAEWRAQVNARGAHYEHMVNLQKIRKVEHFRGCK